MQTKKITLNIMITCLFVFTTISISNARPVGEEPGLMCYILEFENPYVGKPVDGPCPSPGGWGIYRNVIKGLEWSVRVGFDPVDNRWELIYVHDNPTGISTPATSCPTCDTDPITILP